MKLLKPDVYMTENHALKTYQWLSFKPERIER